MEAGTEFPGDAIALELGELREELKNWEDRLTRRRVSKLRCPAEEWQCPRKEP